MSLGAPPSQPRERKLFNIDGTQTSSAQQEVVGAAFAGTRLLSLIWLSPIYNLVSKNVSTGSGKASSKGAGGPGEKKWYGDFAGFACVCPDDAPTSALLYVLVNGNVAFRGPLSAGGGFYSPFTLETYCQECRWYYGKKDQPIDDLVLTQRGPYPDPDYPGIEVRNKTTWPTNSQIANEAGPLVDDDAGDQDPLSGHYDFHPGYRNQCIFVFKKFALGNSATRPNIQVLISRKPLLIGGGGVYTDTVQGVPPMNFVYELLTDDMFGAGKTDDELDLDSFTDTNAAMITKGNKIAPFIEQAGTIKGWLADFAPYGDFWFRRKGATIEAGYFPHGYVDPESLPQIASDDLVGEPNIKPGSDRDTKNEFRINFTNREAWYRDDSSHKYVAQAALFRAGGKRRKETIDRPFILDATVAQSHVTEYGTIYSEIPRTGNASVKREGALGNYRQGDMVTIDSAAVSLAFVFRVLQCDRVSDRDGTLKLTLEANRANWPTLYIQPPDPKDPDFEVYASEVTQALIKELPSGLSDALDIEIGVLARRPSMAEIGFHLWLSTDNVSYDQIQDLGKFAAYGSVAVDYPSSTADLDNVTGFQVDLYGPDLAEVVTQSAKQRIDNNLLIFCELEILSAWTVTPVSGHPGRVKIYSQRAIYGTLKALHEIGQDVWFIYRSQLEPLSNKNFISGTTRYFKIQPYTDGPVIPLGDCDVFSHLFSGTGVKEISGLSLSTLYGVTAAGDVDSSITATWDYALDQDIASFNGRIKKHASVTWGPARNLGADPTAVWNFLEPGVSYDIQIQAINSLGKPSAWSTTATITSANSPSLVKPTFINDYTGTALSDSSYSDVTALSVRVQAAAGKKVRYALNGPVTINSPFWPNFAQTGDGTGTDMAGFIQSTGGGPDQHFTGGPPTGPFKHTTVWHVRTVDPANPTILGPETIITSTYVPVDQSQWPQVAKPTPYVIAGDNAGKVRGDAGYQVRIDCADPTALIYHTPDPATVGWSLATRETVKYPTSSTYWFVGYNHYFQAKRYVATLGWDQYRDSEIAVFSNTASGIFNEPGGGGSGGSTKIQP